MSDHHLAPEIQSLKHSFPILNSTDPNMEIMNQLQDLINPHFTDLSPLNFQTSMAFCPENFLTPDFPANICQEFPANNPLQCEKKTAPRAHRPESMNLKITDQTPESSLTHSSPAASANATKRTNCGGRRKRKRNGEEEEEEGEKKPREVVHVRAKRGQATDSHSLAERVRREKINERLRCLQEIVPGCYKTMGMAVMLDEIINYVQSLQNQVEFLSLKLAAASTYYDFNSERDTIGNIQRAKAYEGLKMQKAVREGVDVDHNFGSSYPSLPHNNT